MSDFLSGSGSCVPLAIALAKSPGQACALPKFGFPTALGWSIPEAEPSPGSIRGCCGTYLHLCTLKNNGEVKFYAFFPKALLMSVHIPGP